MRLQPELEHSQIWRFFSYGNWQYGYSHIQTQHLCTLFFKHAAYWNHPKFANKCKSTIKQYLLIPLDIISSSHFQSVFASSTCSDKSTVSWHFLSVYANPQISYYVTHSLLQLGKNTNLKLPFFHFLSVALFRHGYTHKCQCYRLVAMMLPQFQYHITVFTFTL